MNIVDLIEKGKKTGNTKHYWEAGGLAAEQAFGSAFSVIVSFWNPWIGAGLMGTGVYGTQFTESIKKMKP